VWATARLNQVPFVFSEDFRDGSILEGVRFVNPFSPKFLLEKWF
jgi:predicted nucleic acid-binding protein